MAEEEEIVRADKKRRIWVLAGLGALALMGALAIHGASDRLDEVKRLSASNPREAMEKLQGLVTVFRIANAAISLVSAAWLFSTAARILRSGRFPPEGMVVVRDVKVIRGVRAKLAAAGSIGSGLMILATNVVGWRLQAMLDKLAHRG